MAVILDLKAMEVLDSRGRPTIKATCTLKGGSSGTVSVPSGASTGAAEALELRDRDQKRYGGLGCRKAVANINGEVLEAVAGKSFKTQQSLDEALIALDGTANKSRLGANAVLAISLAYARAQANRRHRPLYEHFASLLGRRADSLPRLTINLFSGGKHAGGQVPVQDVLIVPVSAKSIDDGLAMTYAVYQAAADLCRRKYGMRALKADEGGLAPPFPGVDEMLRDALESIRGAGFEPRHDAALAVDVASSHFHNEGSYHLGAEPLSPAKMIEQLDKWVETYPIVSLEDGLAEEDWQHWPALRSKVGGSTLVLGDDFLCTNPHRIRRAVESSAANALLLKVNQIGTLSEAAEACRLARSADWRVTVSARSGETEDDWLADLAVGWGADQIKVGSITQSERLAKYNRLLEIEAQTGFGVVEWPAGSVRSET